MEIEIPFGAKDSELTGWEYTIPEDMEAVIKDGKVIVKKKESEDERIRKEIIHHILYKANGVSEEQEHSWVAYLEKQKEQKSEQSEMEKEYVRTLHSLISDFLRGKQEIDREYYQKIWDWLDNRHIEQKPAEWSEDDADMLNCCISSIEEAKENRYVYKETDGDTSYDREIDWLKSLRPSWKPSEEQMGSLRLAIDSAKKAQMYATADILNEIYEQLKKL